MEIILSDQTHLALIQQVNVNACMIRHCNDANARALGADVPIMPTLQHLVLQHGVGRYCTANKWAGIRRGAIKNCYGNAAQLVYSNPDRFIYVEGYGCREELGLVVGEHAWVLDRSRGFEVLDVTWRNTKAGAYLGIPFSYDYLSKQIAEHRYYGLLDTPWSRWPVRRLPVSDWLHPEAASIPRDFSVPDNLPDHTVGLEAMRMHYGQ